MKHCIRSVVVLLLSLSALGQSKPVAAPQQVIVIRAGNAH